MHSSHGGCFQWWIEFSRNWVLWEQLTCKYIFLFGRRSTEANSVWWQERYRERKPNDCFHFTAGYSGHCYGYALMLPYFSHVLKEICCTEGRMPLSASLKLKSSQSRNTADRHISFFLSYQKSDCPWVYVVVFSSNVAGAASLIRCSVTQTDHSWYQSLKKCMGSLSSVLSSEPCQRALPARYVSDCIYACVFPR